MRTLATFFWIIVGCSMLPVHAHAWSYCFAETNGGKIVKLEVVSWGTGDVATGGKPAFGGATLTITGTNGEVILNEKFKDGEYDFSGLPGGRTKVLFSASTETAEVELSFTGVDQESDGDEMVIKALRNQERIKDPGNSLRITDKKSGTTYSFKDIVCHLVKDA